MTESWHVVGQKVVCIDDRPHYAGDEVALRLSIDEVYTVRSVTTDDVDTAVGFLLLEIRNRPAELLTTRGVVEIEPAYAATRFRPAQISSIGTDRSLRSPKLGRTHSLEPA